MCERKRTLPPQPPDKELAAAAGDVAYEIKMCVGVILRLERGEADSCTRYALIESMAVHFRNLEEFFFFSEGQTDDARAFHYVDRWPDDVLGAGAFNALRDRVNKQVNHLTYARIRYTEHERQWPFLNMLATVRAVWGAFWARVPPERRPWFELKPEELALLCPPPESGV